MTALDRSPTRPGSLFASVAALVAVGLPGLYSWLTLGAGMLGLILLGSAVLGGRQSAATVGSGLVFVGVIVAGLEGAPEVVLLVATVATVLAWDSASTAISLGRQLGSETPTTKVEVVHVGATALVGGAAVAIAYGLYTVVAGEGSLTAVVFLVLAAVLFASVLR